jgi:ferredoxin
MTYVITEPCIETKDRSCVDVCPVDCIHDDGDADKILYINPEECIDCGACEPACPVTAIFVDYDVPEQWSKFGEINALWYTDRDAARAQVDQYLASKEG